MRRASRQNLVLLETVAMLGVFITALAVCVGLFASAALTSRQSERLGLGALCCQTAAEAFKAADGSPERTAELLGGELNGDTLLVRYNGAFERDDGGEMLLTVSFSNNDGVSLADIALTADGEGVFALRAAEVTDGE